MATFSYGWADASPYHSPATAAKPGVGDGRASQAQASPTSPVKIRQPPISQSRVTATSDAGLPSVAGTRGGSPNASSAPTAIPAVALAIARRRAVGDSRARARL